MVMLPNGEQGMVVSESEYSELVAGGGGGGGGGGGEAKQQPVYMVAQDPPQQQQQPAVVASVNGFTAMQKPKVVDSSHSMIKSPTRRVREGKKCRKVYGLEQRDLWCTQCKWKKACARFGSGAATAAASAGSTSSGSPATVHSPNTSAVNLSTSQPAAGSLLMAAPVNHSFLRAPAARAIKF